MATLFTSGRYWTMKPPMPGMTPGEPAVNACPAGVVKSSLVTPLPMMTGFLPFSASYSSLLPNRMVPVSTMATSGLLAISVPHLAPSSATEILQATAWSGRPAAPPSSLLMNSIAALRPMVFSGK